MLKEFYSEVDKIFQDSHPFSLLVKDVLICCSNIWNYQIFKTSNGQGITTGKIVLGILLLMLGLRLAKHSSRWIKKKFLVNKNLDASLATSFEKLSYYLFIGLIVIFILDVTNVPLTAFAVVGTTLALGIGLGSQNLVNNFISGLIIMLERPIKVGDIIEIKSLNVVGQVVNIGARCVCVKTDHNINVLLPNSNILQDSLINWTLDDTVLKIVMPLQVTLNSSLVRIDEILTRALNQNALVLKDPQPKILLKEIGKESLTLETEFWINLDSGVDKKYIINDLNRAIEPLFRKNNVETFEKANKV